jgi:hypothetical protein
MNRRSLRRRTSRALTLFLAASAPTLGTAVACIELPAVQSDATGGAAGIDSSGGESSDDSSTGGTTTGGSLTGGSSSGGSATGGSLSGGSGGSGLIAGGSGGATSAGGTSGSTGSGGSSGSSAGGTAGKATGGSGGASGGKGGTSGTAGKGGTSGTGSGGKATGGSAGYSTNRDDFFGASRCGTGLDLCDDFEATSINTTRWRVQGPAPTVDSTRAARGMRSVHFHTTDNGLSLLHTTAIFPATNNTYWARVFVYFDTMPTAPMWAHWSISAAVGSGTDTEVRVGGQYDGSKNRFGVGTDHGETGDWTNLDEDPGNPVPVDAWVCLEWQNKGDTNETRFFWDGVEHPSLHTTATDHGGSDTVDYELPTFESVYVGWWLYQPETTPGQFDVWIDEVAFDSERIGCSR